MSWERRQSSGPYQDQHKARFLTFGEEVRFGGITRLSSLHLSEDCCLRFTYESLFPPLIRGKIADHFTIGLESDEGYRLIKSVSEDSVPLHEQVDTVFPRLVEGILSQHYVCVTLRLNNIFGQTPSTSFPLNTKGEDSPQSSSLHVN